MAASALYKSILYRSILFISLGIFSFFNTSELSASKTQKWNEKTDVPIFIIIGQSNADGSAMFNDSIDRVMKQWYESDANKGKMKIWYRSAKVQNQLANALGEAARWVVDGDTTDMPPGWLDLWYRNENTSGRTAMTMIHGYGTYSTGKGRAGTQGRRGMEAEFGKAFATSFPDSELYILKLGASGSFISSWANPEDDTNWNYFYNNIFTPAISDLLKKGKRPRLAGVWWMQGCADASKSQAYYQECLTRLINRIEKDLGFKNPPIYIGHIRENSVQYGENVRKAQDAVASMFDNVEIVDTDNFPLQYEKAFRGYLHFNQEGQNAIGDELANRIINSGRNSWPVFSKPRGWKK